MCGITLVAWELSAAAVDAPAWLAPLQYACTKRGPDQAESLSLLLHSGADAAPAVKVDLFSAVLGTRAPLTRQPFSSDSFALAWNGQVWQGMEYLCAAGQVAETNDGAALFAAIERRARGGDVAQILGEIFGNIEGPYAFALVDKRHNAVYYARDPLGRRSLLRAHDAGRLVLASVGCAEAQSAGLVLDEVPCHAIWRQDLRRLCEEPIAVSRTSALTVRLSVCAATADEPDAALDDEDDAEERLLQELQDAVARRSTGIAGGVPGSAVLAVLYSGGLDSATLALLAHRAMPPGPIDLLTVAFANPRVLAAAAKAPGHASPYDTPDRLTARLGLRELQALAPAREWRLVEIDVAAEEYEAALPFVRGCMEPCDSVMDLSIAAALYFAARGWGRLADGPDGPRSYASQARVLLSGLGADELLGGYSRHRRAWERGGAAALTEELQLDIDRLPSRNLGRDDRVMSCHGREVRHPFLDRRVMAYLCGLPLHRKMDLAQRPGAGDKRILRQVARRLGMAQTAGNVKRAIQFGARSAKMGAGDGRIKGHERLD